MQGTVDVSAARPDASLDASSRGLRRLMRRYPEAVAGAVVAVVVFGLSWTGGPDGPQLREMHQHLGAEYYNIGRALADGRGYSDPFGERTGPTAWMPPIYPTLIAILLLVTGTRAATAAVILTLTKLAYVAIGATIHGLARRCRLLLPAWLAVAFYLVWIVAFHFWTLLSTHDVWLIALGVDVVAVAVYRHFSGRPLSRWGWGVLGGILALTSPALVFAWAAVVVLFAVQSRGKRAGWLASAALALAIGAPWAVRNAVVFRKFIPLKSNLYFDAYQANYVDDDGVWDQKSLQLHPYTSPNLRFKYAQWGESGFLDHYRSLFVEAVRERPRELFRRAANRLLAAVVVYAPVDAASEGTTGLIVRRLIYPLPLLALLGTISIRGPNRRLLGTLAFFCAAYLAPYVFLAFYVRYLLPLLPMLVLVAFLGFDRLLARFCRGGSRPLPGPRPGAVG